MRRFQVVEQRRAASHRAPVLLEQLAQHDSLRPSRRFVFSRNVFGTRILTRTCVQMPCSITIMRSSNDPLVTSSPRITSIEQIIALIQVLEQPPSE